MASELPMTAARPASLEEAELHYHTALALTAPAQPDIEDMDTSHLRINTAMAAATLQSDIAKEAVSRHDAAIARAAAQQENRDDGSGASPSESDDDAPPHPIVTTMATPHPSGKTSL